MYFTGLGDKRAAGHNTIAMAQRHSGLLYMDTRIINTPMSDYVVIIIADLQQLLLVLVSKLGRIPQSAPTDLNKSNTSRIFQTLFPKQPNQQTTRCTHPDATYY